MMERRRFGLLSTALLIVIVLLLIVVAGMAFLLLRTKDEPLQPTVRDLVVIAAGQSNMSGSDARAPSGLYLADPRLVKYDRSGRDLVTIEADEGGLYAALGRAVLESAPLDTRVIVVPAAAGETGFTTSSLNPLPDGFKASENGTWDRALDSDPLNRYSMMVNDYLDVVRLSPKSKAVGLFWSQGESDVGSLSQSEYSASLDGMVSAFRESISNPTLPVVVGSMVPEFVSGGSKRTEKNAIQNALTDTPRRVLNSAYVYGPEGMMRSDQASSIHFATAGNLERARSLVRALDRARWNFTESKAIPPQDLRVVRSGAIVTATYEPPPTRHTLFTIEYSIDGGATWAPMVKPAGEIGLSAIADADPARGVQVRASTTNDTNTSPYVSASA